MTQSEYEEMLATLDRIEAESGLERPETPPEGETEWRPASRAQWLLDRAWALALTPEDWGLLRQVADT